MKISTILTVVSSMLVVLLNLTSIRLLSDLSEPTPDLTYSDLESGWLLPMFCGPTLWSTFPSLPLELTAVWDLPAFLYVSCCLLFVAIPLILRYSVSFTTASAVLLPLGALPMVAGAIVLRGGSASPVEVGTWASFMIVGWLYAALASFALALVDLARSMPRSMPRLGTQKTFAPVQTEVR